MNGYLGALLLAAAAIFAIDLGYSFIKAPETHLLHLVASVCLMGISLIGLSALTIVSPNQAKVITFFGKYLGTIRANGLFLTIPWTMKQPVSLKVRNFNSSKLKVNDVDGNPIEIAAVVVFYVKETAKAMFDVEYYENFVEIQSETAIRQVATKYPYDSFDEGDVTLRGHAQEVSTELTAELQERLAVAGVEVREARLTHLAYSTEIASAMLQRQQAKAILSARQIIVDGAVGMTQLALKELEKDERLELTSDHRVKLVNNLLVSIITDRGTQPVINTGEVNE